METTSVTEQDILIKLRSLDPQRWEQVLDFIGYLIQSTYAPPLQHERKVLTARDLLESDLVGLWADRQDIVDSLAFARHLRHQAENRENSL